jgi:hypothetical protein
MRKKRDSSLEYSLGMISGVRGSLSRVLVVISQRFDVAQFQLKVDIF